MNYESYNEKSDIWSLGCMLYEMCSLRPPFTATTQSELASKICTGAFTRIPMRYSDDLNRVISVMICVEVCMLVLHFFYLLNVSVFRPKFKEF